MKTWLEFVCTESGQRLDLFLAEQVKELSRSRAQKLIDSENVLVNGVNAKSRTLLVAGDQIKVSIPEPVSTTLIPESIPLNIVYEDDELMVIDKEPGLVVHPGAGNWQGTLVQALLFHCGDKLPSIGGELRPGIVHRIDKNTSGILVVAKTDRAHQSLSQQFKLHTIQRQYLGLAWGPLLREEGSYLEAIARDPRDRKRMWVREDGKSAHTNYKVNENFRLGAESTLTLFTAELLTGRTHQIRVHFAFHGFPLVGDAVYGNAIGTGRSRKEKGLQNLAKKNPAASESIRALYQKQRHFLHAAFLAFDHPIHGKRIEFSSPLPADLAKVLDQLRC